MTTLPIDSNSYHKPVLLAEIINVLNVQHNQTYIDCTLGGGGHTQAILAKNAQVLGLDQDQQALDFVKKNFTSYLNNKQLLLAKDNFANIKSIVKNNHLKPFGVIFDLGVSSHQLQGNKRGFSFQIDEDLDMRMDPENQTITAKSLVNGLYQKELEKLILTYGEDQLAHSISKSIISERKFKPIETTFELAEIIKKVYQHTYRRHSKKNPATKTFQALRIAVNDEINNLKKALVDSLAVCQPNSVIAVITFHGLEDKLVKNQFNNWEFQGMGNCIVPNPILPSFDELYQNPRSSSAKLRAFKKNNI